MASQQQFEYFKDRFKEEDDRNTHLTKRAEIYLSLVTLIFAGLLFKVEDLNILCTESEVTKYIMYVILFCILCSVFFLFQSIKIRDYTSDMDVSTYIEELGQEELDDSEFFDNRIAHYINAAEENFKINNKKAGKLQTAGIFIFLSVLLIIVVIALNIS